MRKLNRLQYIMLTILAVLFVAFVVTSFIAFTGVLPMSVPIMAGSLMIPFVFALKAQVQEEEA